MRAVLLSLLVFGCSCSTIGSWFSSDTYDNCSPILISPITHKLFFAKPEKNRLALELPNNFSDCPLKEIQVLNEKDEVVFSESVSNKLGGFHAIELEVPTAVGSSGLVKVRMPPVKTGVFSAPWTYRVINKPAVFVLEKRDNKSAFYLTKTGTASLSLDGIEYGFVSDSDVMFLPLIITKTQLRLVWVNENGTPSKVETFILNERSYQ